MSAKAINDNVLYHSLLRLTSPQHVWGSLSEMGTICSSGLPTRNAPNDVPGPWRVCRYESRERRQLLYCPWFGKNLSHCQADFPQRRGVCKVHLIITPFTRWNAPQPCFTDYVLHTMVRASPEEGTIAMKIKKKVKKGKRQAQPKQVQMRSKAARSNIAEGTRLFALAGRPTKSQLGAHRCHAHEQASAELNNPDAGPRPSDKSPYHSLLDGPDGCFLFTT